MSRLFQLGEDDFRHILSWLDISSIRFLDVAVGNKKERSWWFDSLHTMDNKSINEYMYCHTSIRWLIERGARATGIQVRATSYQERELKRTSIHRITDETFAGVGNLPTQNRDSVKRGILSFLRSVGTCIFRICRIKHHSCRIRMQQYPHLKSIRLLDCDGISDIGVSVIVKCCPHLTSIDISGIYRISDIGMTAIAEGCPHLVSISLRHMDRLSDFGMAAIARGCPHLTSIDLGG